MKEKISVGTLKEFFDKLRKVFPPPPGATIPDNSITIDRQTGDLTVNVWVIDNSCGNAVPNCMSLRFEDDSYCLDDNAIIGLKRCVDDMQVLTVQFELPEEAQKE